MGFIGQLAEAPILYADPIPLKVTIFKHKTPRSFLGIAMINYKE
jgi:hypothetical protein